MLLFISDYEESSRRRYKKDVDSLKPDLKAYEERKAATVGSSSTALAASADLYRDANSLIYADSKPSEDAIDRVVAKINLEYVTYLLYNTPILDIWTILARIADATSLRLGSMRRKAISHTSMRRTRFSTRRYGCCSSIILESLSLTPSNAIP